jgi:predicted nucleic acid-binding protein
VIGFVLDASVAIAWCFEDETDRDAQAVMDLLQEGSAIVPTLWHYEIANVLFVAERRGRISKERAAKYAQLYRTLPITVDPDECDISDLIAMARVFALSPYDAAYVALSVRRDLPLATRDRAQAKAAKAAGVRLLP